MVYTEGEIHRVLDPQLNTITSTSSTEEVETIDPIRSVMQETESRILAAKSPTVSPTKIPNTVEIQRALTEIQTNRPVSVHSARSTNKDVSLPTVSRPNSSPATSKQLTSNSSFEQITVIMRSVVE